MASISHTTLFDINSQSANFEQIVTDVTGAGIALGESVTIKYEVVGPNSVVLRNFPASPDATLTQGSPTSSMPNVNLPKTTSGDIQEGTYVINIQAESSLSGALPSLSSTLVLDVKKQSETNCKIDAQIDIAVDCVCTNLTVTDNTDYKNVTLISREITIVPPTVPNEPAPTNVTTTNQSVTVSFGYTNVTYQTNLDSLYEHYYTASGVQLDNDTGAVFTVQEDLVATTAKEIKCDIDLCQLLKCIDDKTRELLNRASDAGGLTKLPHHLLDDMLLVNKYLNLFNSFYGCGDYKKAQEYYEKLNKLLNCDCGCDTGNADTPKAISNACGTSSGPINAINGTPPVNAPNVAGTVTISLDAAFVSSVNNALQSINATNTNGDGFLSDDGGNGVEFDSSPMQWSMYSVFGNADAEPGIDFDNTPIPLRYRYNTFFGQMAVDGSFAIASPSTGMAMSLHQSPLAEDSARVTIPIPGFDDNGECVGNLAVIGISGNQKFIFSPNTNYVAGEVIRVNGIINLV